MSLRGLLTQTCTIQTKTVSGTDAYGHESYTWANTYTDVLCRLYTQSAASARERYQNVDIGIHQQFVALLPDQAISREDRIIVDAETFEVVGPPTTHRDYGTNHHQTVQVRPYQ